MMGTGKNSAPGDEQARLLKKLEADKYYAASYAHFKTLQAMKEAGFFDDGIDPAVLALFKNPGWLSTPLNKVAQAAKKRLAARNTDNQAVVLLTTGGFAPFHEGHRQMMEAAKAACEAAGMAVLGGFLAPAHDSYVLGKGSRADEWPASRRLQVLQQALRESSWLAADPWMCRDVPGDLNFTDVIERLEAYVNRHVATEKPIRVVYVFGGDNAFFARAFLKDGLAVCVNRPGYEGLFDKAKKEMDALACTQVHFVRTKSVALASSDLRTEKTDQPAPNQRAEEASDPETYLVRDDLDWALEPWKPKADETKLARAKDRFLQRLVDALQAAFVAAGEKGNVRIAPVILPARRQKEILERDFRKEALLNLDLVTQEKSGDFGFSRLFQVSDEQAYSQTLVPRGDENRMRAYLQGLPRIPHWLCDDDVATGSTVKQARASLEPFVPVAGTISLSELVFSDLFPGQPFRFLDIVDARDFLVGSRASGLVVQMFDGHVARVPYLLPYVTLANRARLPPGSETEFSRRLIEANMAFHEEAGLNLTLADLDAEIRPLVRAVSFPLSQSCHEFLKWHLERLR